MGGEQQPHVGVVQGPQDVGGGGDVEVGAEAAVAGDRFDDRALVGVEVVLDQRPQVGAVGVDRGGGADGAQQRPDALFDDAGVVGHELDLPARVGLGEELLVPGPSGDPGVVGVALEGAVPDGAQQG